LVQIAKDEIKKEIKQHANIKIGHSVADSNLIGNLNIPTIDLGPSGDNEHQVNEFVDIRSLLPSYRILKGIIGKLN